MSTSFLLDIISFFHVHFKVFSTFSLRQCLSINCYLWQLAFIAMNLSCMDFVVLISMGQVSSHSCILLSCSCSFKDAHKVLEWTATIVSLPAGMCEVNSRYSNGAIILSWGTPNSIRCRGEAAPENFTWNCLPSI